MAASVAYDRVRETSTTTGTGNFTLAGAVTGYRTFTSVVSTNSFYYCIAHQTATEWEVGLGSLSAGALVRGTVIASTNSNNAVNFSAGTKDVFLTIPANLAALLTNGTALSVLGVAGNAAAEVAAIAAANDGEVLRRSGTSIGFGSIVVGALPSLNGLTDADPALADVVPIYDTSATANRDAIVSYLLGLLRVSPGGRLTAATGVPLGYNDITGATTVYYAPYVSDVIVLWDGTRWVATHFAETSLALGTVSSGFNYDVFGFLSGGVLALEKLVWTNDLSRAIALSYQDGRLCKATDPTRLYLGTFRTTSTTQTEDSDAKRFVWNHYNQAQRRLKKTDSTDSWTYTTATWRSANNSTANRVEVVTGQPAPLDLQLVASGENSASLTGIAAGIDEDGTTSNDSDLHHVYTGPAAARSNIVAFLRKSPTVGYHFYQWTEYSVAVGTTTWYGDGSIPDLIQSGLLGWIMG